MQNIRIANVVMNCPFGQTENNLDKIQFFVSKAYEKQVDVICFPELSVTGYNNQDFVNRFAETIPGESTNFIVNLSKKFNICILAGLIEKNGTFPPYITHIVSYPSGNIHLYRKTHLGPPEKSFFSQGQDLSLFEYKGTRFGIQICYDSHFPEISTHMALSGADLIFFPHASPRGSSQKKFQNWSKHLIARAYDNSVFVAACNQTGSNGIKLNFPGLAIIIDPSGNVINHNIENIEQLIITDLYAESIENVRNNRMKYFLYSRRPELYCK